MIFLTYLNSSNWGVSKLKCFETKPPVLRNKTNFCETKQKNVRWIFMKQKIVSQHSNIYLILNGYFLREYNSFKGYRAFVEAYHIVQWWWWQRRCRKNENMVLFYPCSMKTKGENSYPQVDDISTNPQVDTMYSSWANRTYSW